MSRTIVSNEDCADCLCRICERNECNDMYNPNLSKIKDRHCTCDCNLGDVLIELPKDCIYYVMESED